jgi:hypothetical protein
MGPALGGRMGPAVGGRRGRPGGSRTGPGSGRPLYGLNVNGSATQTATG